jgi:hypothetical protein
MRLGYASVSGARDAAVGLSQDAYSGIPQRIEVQDCARAVCRTVVDRDDFDAPVSLA